MRLKEPSFLDNILKKKTEKLKKIIAQDPYLFNIKEKAKYAPGCYDFYSALNASPYLSVIAEIKRASPSRGMMRSNIDTHDQSKVYQEFGASALSVITEEDFFSGSLDDLVRARNASSLPILRKDFIIHPYQIYEARASGADAILLIAAALTGEELSDFVKLTHDLGMHALVEIHREEEISTAVGSGTMIIGINNRDLNTFHVDIKTTAHLAPMIPDDKLLLVSESGIKGPKEAEEVASWGVKAILVGEALITAEYPGALLKSLRQIRCVPV